MIGNSSAFGKRVRSAEATHKTVDEEILSGDHDSHDNDAEVTVDDFHELESLDPEKIARRDYLLERDARQYPAEKLLVFCVLWAGLTLLTFLKGGKGVDSIVGITCEDVWYGVLIAAFSTLI